MTTNYLRTATALSCVLGVAGTLFVGPSAQAKPPRKAKPAKTSAKDTAGSAKAQVTALIADFEKAYQRKDKQTDD